ncbi:MAG: hypothetical protein KIT02_09670 [Devosia sp.]|uniref:hypothetical protein n=1 Tax=Devosia sp. TaxID=1871048 RepID=UPI0024CB87C3|nr:hypothetical protein [Devosia sp.]UYN98242.1 MAG: hypothetical protein KIT02_09670 [Devosia sp.]
MATAATFTTTASTQSVVSANLRPVLTMIVCAGLPMGIFGLVNLVFESLGVLPLFFAPFGLPGWAGGAIHLFQLALLGGAFWALLDARADRATRLWLAAFTSAYILLPFITPPLDSLQLGILCSSLFLLALAALRRAGAASPLAGWLMAPVLSVLGLSAAMGLVITAAYTPPFALIQGQNPVPPAA